MTHISFCIAVSLLLTPQLKKVLEGESTSAKVPADATKFGRGHSYYGIVLSVGDT